ncbi:hypothetical protein EON64_03570, partial [archaeon]
MVGFADKARAILLKETALRWADVITHDDKFAQEIASIISTSTKNITYDKLADKIHDVSPLVATVCRAVVDLKLEYLLDEVPKGFDALQNKVTSVPEMKILEESASSVHPTCWDTAKTVGENATSISQTRLSVVNKAYKEAGNDVAQTMTLLQQRIPSELAAAEAAAVLLVRYIVEGHGRLGAVLAECEGEVLTALRQHCPLEYLVLAFKTRLVVDLVMLEGPEVLTGCTAEQSVLDLLEQRYRPLFCALEAAARS